MLQAFTKSKNFSILFLILLFGQAVFAQIEVYPKPQQIELGKGELKITAPLGLKGADFADAATLTLLDSLVGQNAFPFNSNVKNAKSRTSLTIKKLPKGNSELQRSGAYRLSIRSKGISIEAFDKRSVFYAAQTLSQLIDKEEHLPLPYLTITDFPDVAFRGTVEGFYGEPWSHKDRLEQLRFYGKYKLNTYIYGPKDDPYHSSPHWRDAYPDADAAQLKSLIDEAHKNEVDFVWAIHPGKDIQWNKADSNAVIHKFEMMYDLGVRSFAVFFDDISGVSTDARKQAELLNFIKKEFSDRKKDVLPLIMCPTEYNKSWANKERGTYLDILGDMLDPSIQVMWTGNRVISDNTLEGLEWVNARIKRPAYVWWNFPVSDYVRNHLLMGPAYGLEKGAAHAMSGFVSNPMDKAEASKVAIFSIANYSWNLKGYDSDESWKKGSALLLPEAAAEFLTFNAHNSDLGPNGHGYRRDESVEIKPIMDSFLASYKGGAYDQTSATRIQQEFMAIQKAAIGIPEKSRNMRLIEQISPWIQHFGALGKAGEQSMEMIANIQRQEKDAAWRNYLLLEKAMNEMSEIDLTHNQNPYQPGIKTGSLVLEPFIKELITYSTPYFADSLLFYAGSLHDKRFIEKLKESKVLSNAVVFQRQPLIIRNDYVAFSPILEVVNLANDEFLGLAIPEGLIIKALEVNLENADLTKWGVFESSDDGEHWESLKIRIEKGRGEMKIKDSKNRMIRFRSTANEKQSFYLKTFKLIIEDYQS